MYKCPDGSCEGQDAEIKKMISRALLAMTELEKGVSDLHQRSVELRILCRRKVS
jgi:hypothetical protein